MIKPLHPDQVWQPKLGAPYGNRNAFKAGKHTVGLVAWRKSVASWRRRVRAALAAAPAEGGGHDCRTFTKSKVS